MYVCSRVYIKNYSRIFLEWIIAKKGWVQIRSLSSAIYFVFMFLSLVTQTCSISSFRSAVLVPLRGALGLGLPSLPRHRSGVGTQLSSALLGWALVVLKRWRVCSSLQMWPSFLVRTRGIGDRGWVLGAAYRCSGESRARVPQVSLNWAVQRSFSGTCVCVKGLNSFRADVVGILMDGSEPFWTGWVFLCCEFTELGAACSEDRKWKQKALASHLPLVGEL